MDLIGRLRRGDAIFYYATMNEAADEIERLQRENEELRQRLEIDPRTKYDGIACRDATIKQLERENEELLKALGSMLTHMGMDEDEWNKPTFDQARAALKALSNDEFARAERSDALKAQSTEPMAWVTPSGLYYEENEDGFSDWTPLFRTPPTATALVENFRKRVLEVVRPSPTLKVSKALQPMKEQGDGVREVLADIIESLPLIEGEK